MLLQLSMPAVQAFKDGAEGSTPGTFSRPAVQAPQPSLAPHIRTCLIWQLATHISPAGIPSHHPPVEGDRIFDPNPVFIVVVRLTAIPESSTTERWDVPASRPCAPAVTFQRPPYSVRFSTPSSLMRSLHGTPSPQGGV